MKQMIIIILLSVLSCKNDTSNTEIVESKKGAVAIVSEIDLKIYDYDGLKPLLNQKDDKIHVVNFWATWCAPCVKELPYFEAIHAKYKSKDVELLLVSLDFPKDYETKLKPFMQKMNIESKVVALDDIDQNRWIPAINKDWSGALPATIIYNGDKRQFYEKSFTQEELETELKQFFKINKL